MDYKELYTEALERARYYHSKDYMLINSVIENIFPELKESEEELTWLTKYIEEEAYSLSMDIRDNEDRLKLKKLQRSLAWLEKQGERKSTENVEKKFCEGDKVVSNQDGKVYIVGTEYSIRGDNICLHEIDGYHKWTNRDDLDKNYHLWTSEETDPCIGCTNDKGCVTCENGNLKEIKIEPKKLDADEVIEWLNHRELMSDEFINRFKKYFGL